MEPRAPGYLRRIPCDSSCRGCQAGGAKEHYGFHDLRRAFATMNAATLTPDALQALMQHKDYQTTQRYINMARQLKPAVENLYVPKLEVADAAG
jgi:integrase